MAKNVVFDEESAARIAAAVKWVEQYSLDETQDPEEPLPPDADKPETVCRELSLVEPSGNLTLVSNVTITGTYISKVSDVGKVVTNVACVNGNLVVTTDTISNLATSSNLADSIAVTESVVTLEDFAEVTTENITLPENQCSDD